MKPRIVSIRYSRTFPFPVAVAYAWLTDYQDDDPQRTNAVQKTRRVLSRTAETVVVEAELEFGKAIVRTIAEVKLDPPAHYSATFTKGALKGSVYDYRLTPTPGGCRLDIEHHIRTTRVKTWLRVLLGRSMIRRQIHRMWEGFAASMEREVPRAASPPIAA